jgi:hypothetical protein
MTTNMKPDLLFMRALMKSNIKLVGSLNKKIIINNLKNKYYLEINSF